MTAQTAEGLGPGRSFERVRDLEEVLDFLGKEFHLNIFITYTLFFVRNTDEVNGTKIQSHTSTYFLFTPVLLLNRGLMSFIPDTWTHSKCVPGTQPGPGRWPWSLMLVCSLWLSCQYIYKGTRGILCYCTE